MKISLGKKLAVVVLSASMALLPLLPTVAAVANSKPSFSHQQTQKHSKNIIHIKLKNDSGVDVEQNQFVGGPADQVQRLNTILSAASRVKAEHIVSSQPKNDLQASLKDKLNNYYKVVFAKDVNTDNVVLGLRSLDIVEAAYAEPKAVPLPSASYVSLQNYLKVAPTGINSNYAQTFPGGKGDKATIVDIEYSWNINHEDLPKSSIVPITNGTPIDPFNDNNHGTAVLGEMVAGNNTYGVTGVVPSSRIALVNAFNSERGYDPLTALYIAAYVTQPGDVILIEQQIGGPTSDPYDYVPVEWMPEVYDAVKFLTDNSRIVVEPAGNGNQNLDDSNYYGSSFPMGKADSGAIIVGSNLNCSYDTALRSRNPSSTYGSRINLQGPGDCVATTGYGDLDGGTNPNTNYTGYFSATSAASPVVAAAAAAVMSAYKTLNNNNVLTPLQVRNILMQTGTPQNFTDTSALSGNIGPYPNLAKALLKTDITVPSAPTNVKAVLNSSKQPVVTWSAATDNNKVSYYKLYRNGVYYKKVTTTSFTDTSVTLGSTYSYKLKAVDPSGNVSGYSLAASITVR